MFELLWCLATSNGDSFVVFLGSKKEFCILFFLAKWAKS
jgi:hypothetical protein